MKIEILDDDSLRLLIPAYDVYTIQKSEDNIREGLVYTKREIRNMFTIINEDMIYCSGIEICIGYLHGNTYIRSPTLDKMFHQIKSYLIDNRGYYVTEDGNKIYSKCKDKFIFCFDSMIIIRINKAV